MVAARPGAVRRSLRQMPAIRYPIRLGRRSMPLLRLFGVRGQDAALRRREREVVGVRRERAASDAPAVEVDEGVLVGHREGCGRQPEPLVDELLAEVVLTREAHRAELPVHATREATVGVDPTAETITRLEDGHSVTGLLEQHRGRQARDAGPHDDHVSGLVRGSGQPGSKRCQQVDGRAHWRASVTATGASIVSTPAHDPARFRPQDDTKSACPIGEPVRTL